MSYGSAPVFTLNLNGNDLAAVSKQEKTALLQDITAIAEELKNHEIIIAPYSQSDDNGFLDNVQWDNRFTSRFPSLFHSTYEGGAGLVKNYDSSKEIPGSLLVFELLILLKRYSELNPEIKMEVGIGDYSIYWVDFTLQNGDASEIAIKKRDESPGHEADDGFLIFKEEIESFFITSIASKCIPIISEKNMRQTTLDRCIRIVAFKPGLGFEESSEIFSHALEKFRDDKPFFEELLNFDFDSSPAFRGLQFFARRLEKYVPFFSENIRSDAKLMGRLEEKAWPAKQKQETKLKKKTPVGSKKPRKRKVTVTKGEDTIQLSFKNEDGFFKKAVIEQVGGSSIKTFEDLGSEITINRSDLKGGNVFRVLLYYNNDEHQIEPLLIQD